MNVSKALIIGAPSDSIPVTEKNYYFKTDSKNLLLLKFSTTANVIIGDQFVQIWRNFATLAKLYKYWANF